MSEELFADGIGEISYEHGVFQIDLVSISPLKRDKEGKAVLEFKQRIVMPPDGFLRSFASMERVVKKLIETGALKQSQMQNDEGRQAKDGGKPPSFS